MPRDSPTRKVSKRRSKAAKHDEDSSNVILPPMPMSTSGSGSGSEHYRLSEPLQHPPRPDTAYDSVQAQSGYVQPPPTYPGVMPYSAGGLPLFDPNPHPGHFPHLVGNIPGTAATLMPPHPPQPPVHHDYHHGNGNYNDPYRSAGSGVVYNQYQNGYIMNTNPNANVTPYFSHHTQYAYGSPVSAPSQVAQEVPSAPRSYNSMYGSSIPSYAPQTPGGSGYPPHQDLRSPACRPIMSLNQESAAGRRHSNSNRQHFGNGSGETTLFVFHIPSSMNDDDLFELFAQYGTVLLATVATEYTVEHGKRGRGFGFVTYDSARSAALAIRELHQYETDGKVLKVTYKETKAVGDTRRRRSAPHISQAALQSVQRFDETVTRRATSLGTKQGYDQPPPPQISLSPRPGLSANLRTKLMPREHMKSGPSPQDRRAMQMQSPFVPIQRQSKSPYDAQQANPRITPVPIQEARPRKPYRRQARRGSKGDNVPPSGFTSPTPHTQAQGREVATGRKQPPASESMGRTPAEQVQGMSGFRENILVSEIYSIVVKHTQQRLAPRIVDTLMKLRKDDLRRFLASPEELKDKIRAEERVLLLEARGASPPSQPLSDLNDIGEALPNVEK